MGYEYEHHTKEEYKYWSQSIHLYFNGSYIKALHNQD